MTILPSPLAESKLGEKCALYLDHVTEGLPVFLHSLLPRLDPVLTYSTTSVRSVAQALPFDDETTITVCGALLVCLLTVAAMSWTNPLSNLWRRSPSYNTAPQVRDEDFSYITTDEIVDPSPQTQNYAGQYGANPGDSEPDILVLRHRGTVYPLHFRAYAIDDGLLTVGALRYEAAAKLGVHNPNQIRLLYKGTLLKDDSRTCKAVGLKQHSEVLCVVSEVGAITPSDASDHDNGVPAPGPSGRSEEQEAATPGPSGKSKKNKKKKKGKKATGEQPQAQDGMLGPPPPVDTPPSRPSSRQSGLPPPSPNVKQLKTALEQVTALAGYLNDELIPLCDEYVADPPTDPKKREFEFKKLSETILAQVMLKADGIDPDGNETVRQARKALIKDAQANLKKLDQVGKE